MLLRCCGLMMVFKPLLTGSITQTGDYFNVSLAPRQTGNVSWLTSYCWIHEIHQLGIVVLYQKKKKTHMGANTLVMDLIYNCSMPSPGRGFMLNCTFSDFLQKNLLKKFLKIRGCKLKTTANSWLSLMHSSKRCGKACGRCSQRTLFKIGKENLYYWDCTVGSHWKQERSHW